MERSAFTRSRLKKLKKPIKMELSDAIHELRQMRQGRYVFDPDDNPQFKGFIMDFPQTPEGIPVKKSL